MKLKPAALRRRRGLAWLSALAFTAASVAAQDLVVNQFNDESEVEGKWTRWWGAAAFTDSELNNNALQIGTRKVALVPTTALPAASSGFFRLRQP